MPDTALAPTRHKLDADTYHRMGEAGVFRDTDRIELIDGDLIDMAPIGQGHAGLVTALNAALFRAAGERALVSPQNPVCLDRSSEPQPDLVLLRPRADFYMTGARPGPADVLLLIEVADTSLTFDRTVKLPLYARAGIAEYWIVDLAARAIDAHRGPEGDRYRDLTTHHAGDRVALALAPDIVVSLDLPFPPPGS